MRRASAITSSECGRYVDFQSDKNKTIFNNIAFFCFSICQHAPCNLAFLTRNADDDTASKQPITLLIKQVHFFDESRDVALFQCASNFTNSSFPPAFRIDTEMQLNSDTGLCVADLNVL